MDDQGDDRGDQQAVIVTANGCKGDITVNIKYIFEQREHNTLRRLAEAIQEKIEGRGPCPLMR